MSPTTCQKVLDSFTEKLSGVKGWEARLSIYSGRDRNNTGELSTTRCETERTSLSSFLNSRESIIRMINNGYKENPFIA